MTAEDLLDIVETANFPDGGLDLGNETFECRDGWKVVIFYDAGDLDYIDSIVMPNGDVIDFWDWPVGTPGRETLIRWQGRRWIKPRPTFLVTSGIEADRGEGPVAHGDKVTPAPWLLAMWKRWIAEGCT